MSDTYNRLNNPGFTATPNIEGSRNQGILFQSLGIENPEQYWDPHQNAPTATWAFPGSLTKPEDVQVVLRHFNLPRLCSLANKHGVTLNDVLLTAYYRSLFMLTNPSTEEPLEIMVTVDLRRFLPQKKTDSLCNLSGAILPRITLNKNESVKDTLLSVSQEMNKQKSELPGISTAIVFEIFSKLGYQGMLQVLYNLRQEALNTGKASPILSNIGVIPSIKMGELHPIEAYLVTPAMYAPGLCLESVAI